MRVLVAEDETLIRLDLCRMLERAGFDVYARATDGLQAVKLTRAEQPDVVLVDPKMPKLDGIEAARHIVAERAAPVVVVSAYTERALVERAADAGAYGYLAKPFKGNDLFPAIATGCGRFEELTAARGEALELPAPHIHGKEGVDRFAVSPSANPNGVRMSYLHLDRHFRWRIGQQLILRRSRTRLPEAPADTPGPHHHAQRGASTVQLAAKFAKTVLLRGQATHTPCLQEVFAGACHARAMTPSSGGTVSTAAPEPHGGKRIDEC